MRADEVRTVLESIGKRPTKRLGQHFLLDEGIIRRQVQLASLSPGERVLEIGPGIGNLTEEILRCKVRLVAVEQDPAFCSFLKRRFGDRIELIQADAVKAFLPEFDKVVSNLPYQISSPITFKLLEMGFEVAVLMLQREFAERMVAKPGTRDYGRLSVGVYFHADCEIAMSVSRNAFWPQPRVDSCIVKLNPRPPPFEVIDRELFFKVTRALFSHRRKKASNSLETDPAVADIVTKDMRDQLRSLPHASLRAEQMSPEMIGELSDALHEIRHDRGRISG
jgi:16S rRNA (adenine1518-N6/adenine1519-N6)-dimethyltransferase